ncbi:2-Cys peroxiredoxin BAS1, chloroplastic-like [Musa acuminata AAA Group]|uniref:2-Cys peroxiredoxin BAS1, chloroplastic-like n=1 Tax=Musa acuminata AAA Group TaxID=214697 RepID=UPI0031CFABBB
MDRQSKRNGYLHGTCATPLVYTENPTPISSVNHSQAKREGDCSADVAGSVPYLVAPKATARMASLAPALRPPSRTAMGFHGLKRSSRSRSARLVSASGSPSRSFVVKALSESHLPLLGNKAPDFEAKAVFDEEFIKVTECLTQLQSHSC